MVTPPPFGVPQLRLLLRDVGELVRRLDRPSPADTSDALFERIDDIERKLACARFACAESIQTLDAFNVASIEYLDAITEVDRKPAELMHPQVRRHVAILLERVRQLGNVLADDPSYGDPVFGVTVMCGQDEALAARFLGEGAHGVLTVEVPGQCPLFEHHNTIPIRNRQYVTASQYQSLLNAGAAENQVAQSR